MIIVDKAAAERGVNGEFPSQRPPPYTPIPNDQPPLLSPPQAALEREVPVTQAGRRRPGAPLLSFPDASIPPTAVQPMRSPMLSPEMQEAVVGSQYQQRLLARCARGDHDRHAEYGVGGIITAVLCFPIGLCCLFMDREVKCSRCGERLV